MDQNEFEKKCCDEVNDIVRNFTAANIYNLSDGAVERIKQMSYDPKKNISLIENEDVQLLIRYIGRIMFFVLFFIS